MIQITIERLWPKSKYTIGRLYVNNEYWCNTAEPPIKDEDGNKNTPRKTAIPYGTYRVVMKQSQKFGRMLPMVLNVPNRTGILFHALNNPQTESLGCIGIGENREVGKILNSRYWESKLVELLRYEPHIRLTIK